MGWISSAWKEVKRGASSLGKEIKRAGSKIVNFGKRVIKGIGKVMGELGPLGTMALSLMAPWAVGVLQGMGGWAGTLGNFAAAVGNTVAAPFQALGQAAGKVVGDIGGALASNISNETISSGVMKITESLQTALGYEGGSVSENVSKIANSVSDDWGKVFHAQDGKLNLIKAPIQPDPSKAKIAEKAGTGLGVKGDATVPRPGETPKDFLGSNYMPEADVPDLLTEPKIQQATPPAPPNTQGGGFELGQAPANLNEYAPSPQEAGSFDTTVYEIKPPKLGDMEFTKDNTPKVTGKESWSDRIWDATKKTFLTPGQAQQGQTVYYDQSINVPQAEYPQTSATMGGGGGGSPFFRRPYRAGAIGTIGRVRTGFTAPQY
jgi:hypothetical protein